MKRRIQPRINDDQAKTLLSFSDLNLRLRYRYDHNYPALSTDDGCFILSCSLCDGANNRIPRRDSKKVASSGARIGAASAEIVGERIS